MIPTRTVMQSPLPNIGLHTRYHACCNQMLSATCAVAQDVFEIQFTRRLGRCLQGQALGHRPTHQGRYSTNSGGVRSGGSSPFQSPGMPSHQGTAAQPHLGFHHQMGKPFASQATLSETDVVDVALAVQFPPAQQPFLMFLQAADSHRLNTSLARQDCTMCWYSCWYMC